jgi:hypothetical protein
MGAEMFRLMPYDDWWIGGSDSAVEGDWVWNDGTPFTYSAWSYGQPDNWEGREDCVSVRTWDSYLWNDLPCAEWLPYICAADDDYDAYYYIDYYDAADAAYYEYLYAFYDDYYADYYDAYYDPYYDDTSSTGYGYTY